MSVPPTDRPPSPPQRDDGCLVALVGLLGVILLLPGGCGILLLRDAPSIALPFLALGGLGVWLIVWAFRHPRRDGS